MKKRLTSYKFKLKPNKEQEEIFNQWLGTCRFIKNISLDYINWLYKVYGKSVSKVDIQKQITEIRKEYPWIDNVHSQVLQDSVDRLFLAFDSFFRKSKLKKQGKLFGKLGYPKFSKKKDYKSFKFKQGVKVLENVNKIYLPKIGKIRYFKSQTVIGDIKTAHIIKECDGWYISISCEIIDDIPVNINNKVIGLDKGIKDIIVTSDGDRYGNPKTLRSWESKLRIKQRSVNRKQKGSNNRKKSVKELQKTHKKVRDIRENNLHKVSFRIVNENQIIMSESLNVSGMIRNHCLAKAIQDVSWGKLDGFIRYKAEKYGKLYLEVPAHNTTTDCHACGYRNENLTLDIRQWTCPECGMEHDRDENSGINVVFKGFKLRGEIIIEYLNSLAVGHTVTACGGKEFNLCDIVRPLDNRKRGFKSDKPKNHNECAFA